MNIVIPMAGNGERLTSSGFSLPKPLIKVIDEPMYQWSLKGLPLELATQLVFIIKEDNYSDLLVADIKSHYSSQYPCEIIILKETTQGQAETVLKSKTVLNLEAPTLIHNCDTYVAFKDSWEDLINSNSDGAIALFESTETRWSYAKLNLDKTFITDVQEKRVISSYASTGTYYFKDTTYLLSNIQSVIDQDLRENNEYYLSTVYRLMLQQQKNIAPLWCHHLLCFGTPQDLTDSLNSMLISKNKGC